MPTLPKILLARLSASSERPSTEHPDANLLAAFAEKALPAPERARVLHHLIGCVGCRQAAAFALPEQATIPAHTVDRRFTPALRWAGVVAALGALLVLVVLRFAPERARRALPQPAVVFGRSANRQSPVTAKTTPYVAEAPANVGKVAGRNERLLVRQTKLPAKTQTTVMVASVPPAPLRADLAPVVGSTVATTNTVLWRVSEAGTLQRSADGGRAFEEIKIAPGISLRVVTVLGNNVWTGGANGVLFHSPDQGATWTSAGDGFNGSTVTGIILGGMGHLSVTTGSGLKWVSDDAGHHWRNAD